MKIIYTKIFSTHNNRNDIIISLLKYIIPFFAHWYKTTIKG